MNKKQKEITFFCFTPVVSFSTFVFEFGCAIYIFLRYKSTPFRNLCIATLLFLGIFQLCEFLICTYYNDLWIKIGYSAITILPAMGLHIIATIAKRYKLIVYSAYLLAFALIVPVFFAPQVAGLQAVCQPNFVDVYTADGYGFFHYWYYTAYVLAAFAMLIYSLKYHIGDRTEEKWILIGYTAFVTPSVALVYFKVISDIALPSVMCGFAAIIAVILTLIIIPRYYQLLNRKKKH